MSDIARNSRSPVVRSARIASSTPGYCTLTATCLPSCVRARCTCPMEAAAIGTGSHAAKTRVGSSPSSARITAAQSSGAIGGASCCKRCQRGLHRLGHAVVEVARHLPELHERALHVAERLDHLRGGAQLVGFVEHGALFGRVSAPAGPGARRARRPSAGRRTRAARSGTRRPSPIPPVPFLGLAPPQPWRHRLLPRARWRRRIGCSDASSDLRESAPDGRDRTVPVNLTGRSSRHDSHR